MIAVARAVNVFVGESKLFAWVLVRGIAGDFENLRKRIGRGRIFQNANACGGMRTLDFVPYRRARISFFIYIYYFPFFFTNRS